MADIHFLSSRLRTYLKTRCFIVLKQLRMEKSTSFRYKLVFTIIGVLGGCLYRKFVGCVDGTCPIESVWCLSTLGEWQAT